MFFSVFSERPGSSTQLVKKKNLRIFFTTHQNSLNHSVENNLTIILEWRFFVESEQS